MTLDERILAYLDGSATPAETAELNGILDSDRAARDRFARLCEQDGALRQILSCAPAMPKSRRPARRATTGPTAPWAAIAFVAAGLLFALILAGALSSSPDPAPRPVQIAKPRPAPVEIPEPAPLPQPPPRIEPPPPPKKIEPMPEFVIPKPLPKPEPAPAPEPVPVPVPVPKVDPPPPPPTPKVTEAVVVVARLERIKGQVQVESTPAKEGQALSPGQGVQTVGVESGAQLRMDTTGIELGGDTKIARITNGAGKKIALELGTVTAQVSKQPAGQPLVFVTPHAEAQVVGTKLTLAVSATETRLEVREGRVRLTRRSDGSYVDVTVGQFAIASDAVKPVARKIPPPPKTLFDDRFDDDSRWTRLEGGFPTALNKNAVEINVSPKPGDPPDTESWHASGGLRTRQSFVAPFRVSVDVEITHQHQSLNTLLVLTPKQPGPRTGRNEVAVRLRDGEYAIIVETQHVAREQASRSTPVRERWTMEFGPKEVVLLVNGKRVLGQDHGLTIAQEYFVELQGTAKSNVPPEARVRFDNVNIER